MPVNWNEISSETINILKKFIDKFDFDDIVHGSGSGVASQAENRLNSPLSPLRRHSNSGYVSQTMQSSSSQTSN